MKEDVIMERSESGNYIYVWYTDRDALYRALKAWYDAMHQLPEHAASLHMREVILWTNGMCMVFDDDGQQMPWYQGTFETRYTLINNVFSGNWHYGDWNRGIISATPIEVER